jgi:hypothetical protein
MSSQAATLPRLRRFRRPPARLFFYIVMTLAFAAIAVRLLMRMFEGHLEPFGIIAAAFYAFYMSVTHASMRQAWRAWLDERPVAPVSTREWVWLLFYVALAVWSWA